MTPIVHFESNTAEQLSNSSTDIDSSIDLEERKQRNKEEGKRRAIEISIAKQSQKHQSNNINNGIAIEETGIKRGNRQSVRHGARNQHRHRHFVQWILKTFPHVLNDCIINMKTDDDDDSITNNNTNNTNNNKSALRRQMHILDVAGGKGELSARLTLCHSLHVVMIDPRCADVESVYINTVVRTLPKKWQNSIAEQLKQSSTFVQDELKDRFSQLVIPFTSPLYLDGRFGNEQLDLAVKNASLIIGLHADSATEAVVDAALIHKKPFVVVPCCVFPNLFNERYIIVDDYDDDDDEIAAINDAESELEECVAIKTTKRVTVRTHDQFCKYLLAKDPRFVMETLPFEGRNIAIWWDGR
jgi:2-polyprenyl-3-methyl-5-hydroxy-6-metoxy-1,4-benzoquinol methylase